MLSIRRVHHVAVIASDYERSKNFYTRVLGFEIIAELFRAERNSWKIDLKVPGGGQIELFTLPGAPPRASRPEAIGLRHLAFAVDDLDASVAHLKACGIDVEPVRVDAQTGKRFTFFPDPDGLPLELYEA